MCKVSKYPDESNGIDPDNQIPDMLREYVFMHVFIQPMSELGTCSMLG